VFSSLCLGHAGRDVVQHQSAAGSRETAEQIGKKLTDDPSGGGELTGQPVDAKRDRKSMKFLGDVRQCQWSSACDQKIDSGVKISVKGLTGSGFLRKSPASVPANVLLWKIQQQQRCRETGGEPMSGALEGRRIPEDPAALRHMVVSCRTLAGWHPCGLATAMTQKGIS
jgi:hypothetical protein